jgi:hypothetical protein
MCGDGGGIGKRRCAQLDAAGRSRPSPRNGDLFVLMNHVNIRLRLAHIPYTDGIPKGVVQSLVWNGQFGVQIFFAISGFLIASITLRRWGSLSRVNVRDFYLLRFARIAPLLLALLAVLSLFHFADVKDFVVQPKTAARKSRAAQLRGLPDPHVCGVGVL